MSEVFIHGLGAVSPAGWGLDALNRSLQRNIPLTLRELQRPGKSTPLLVRQVPNARSTQMFMSHPRMRRTSPITRYTVAAALEALGQDAALIKTGSLRVGLVCCVMSGCVNYSRRFYDETLKNPLTASPLVFPETVFNAPSSHLAALLGSKAINYTLVGDPGAFLQGLCLAANWLQTEDLDGCLVVGAEELDWLTIDAFQLFTPQITLSEGAGALYLHRKKTTTTTASLTAVTRPHLFTTSQSRTQAAATVRAQLPPAQPNQLLVDGTQSLDRLDHAENQAWAGWTGPRLSPKRILGEGLMAAAAWQTVLAAHAVQSGTHPAACVSVVGCNQQSTGAQFATTRP